MQTVRAGKAKFGKARVVRKIQKTRVVSVRIDFMDFGSSFRQCVAYWGKILTYFDSMDRLQDKLQVNKNSYQIESNQIDPGKT
jgi:hypothetical protein